MRVHTTTNGAPTGIKLTYGESNDAPASTTVSLDPRENLITKVTRHVLQHHDAVDRIDDRSITVTVTNEIPLGRGLGSSAAAVVAGVLFANSIGQLRLDRPKMLDHCLHFEHHPDNISAALYGGFIASCTVPSTHSSHSKAGSSLDSSVLISRLNISTAIKAVVVVPDFELSTEKARRALPDMYSRADVVSGTSIRFF